MEATGMFWWPIWNVLEGEGKFDLMLVNPQHIKKVPGRKTDVKDAEWLAQLLECGLLRGSFVPPPVIRDLRDLTRYRKRLVEDRVREGLRVQKVLEGAGVKLSSVVSDTLGVSGREMIEALIAGVRDPEVLAEMARARMRSKIPQLQKALASSRFRDHHAVMLRAHLDHLDHLDAAISALDGRIDEVMGPFSDQRDRLTTIPGVGKRAAEVIIAEVGVDMARFPTSAHLSSWAGMCPGNNESAGKHFSGRTRKGSKWLRSGLTQSAKAASRSKGTYFAAQYGRLKGRRGHGRATIAVAHSILVIAFHILDRGKPYEELGADYFLRRNDPERHARKLKRQIEALGYDVTLTPVEAA
jgi:transposase